jgi:hypothetical protein
MPVTPAATARSAGVKKVGNYAGLSDRNIGLDEEKEPVVIAFASAGTCILADSTNRLSRISDFDKAASSEVFALPVLEILNL